MKARLLSFENTIQLLLCTGKIKTLSFNEAYNFLSNYNAEEYYQCDSKWDYENLTMESYRGETIAIVCDEGNLHVSNQELFKQILENRDAELLTVPEFAELHGKKLAIVRRLCQTGRITGAVRKGKTWLIPASSPYPSDERVK